MPPNLFQVWQFSYLATDWRKRLSSLHFDQSTVRYLVSHKIKHQTKTHYYMSPQFNLDKFKLKIQVLWVQCCPLQMTKTQQENPITHILKMCTTFLRFDNSLVHWFPCRSNSYVHTSHLHIKLLVKILYLTENASQI